MALTGQFRLLCPTSFHLKSSERGLLYSALPEVCIDLNTIGLVCKHTGVAKLPESCLEPSFQVNIILLVTAFSKRELNHLV